MPKAPVYPDVVCRPTSSKRRLVPTSTRSTRSSAFAVATSSDLRKLAREAWQPRGAIGLVGVDLARVAQAQTDVVEALYQSVPGELVEREGRVDSRRGSGDRAAFDVHGEFEVGVVRDRFQQSRAGSGVDLDRHQPRLRAVVAEDVSEPR